MVYTILQGNHYANGFSFGFHLAGKTAAKTATFGGNCAYNLEGINQADINKLYGFSEGADHQYNSARFGWRWSIPKQKIELLAYVYNNGHNVKDWEQNLLLADVDLGVPVFTEISITGNYYRFKTTYNGTDSVLLMERTGSGMGYNLYPYFGGDEVAPHTMTIELV